MVTNFPGPNGMVFKNNYASFCINLHLKVLSKHLESHCLAMNNERALSYTIPSASQCSMSEALPQSSCCQVAPTWRKEPAGQHAELSSHCTWLQDGAILALSPLPSSWCLLHDAPVLKDKWKVLGNSSCFFES